MPGLSRSKRTPNPGALVIVGNGIASLRFCEKAVALGLNRRFQITVIGGEAHPAYDRVRLSSYVKLGSASPLIFQPLEWYAENRITLITGDPVVSLTTDEKRVVTQTGKVIAYDELLLATGSSAYVPPIPGVELPGVHVYRTLTDLDGIIAGAKEAKTAVVVGGGLLGLEAAQALKHLGLMITIIERAEFPMPRQLQATAGHMISDRLRELGLEFRGGFSTSEIQRTESGLTMTATDGQAVTADLVVISAGISPNSDIADQAGLRCGVRGGVIVNDQLVTSDPHVHAIGECALHHGQIYGLAAPAATMARHVAQSLAGKKLPPFQTPDLSTRLKMLGVEVTTIGNPLDRGENIEFRKDGCYRMITLSGRRVPVGAIAIGEWPESSLLQGWHLEGRALRKAEADRFEAEGVLDPRVAGTAVCEWPDERLVCNCTQVTKGALCHAMALGACSPSSLSATTGASTVCGSCLPLLEQLCGTPVSQRRGLSQMILIIIAILSLLTVIGSFIIHVPPAESVESWRYQLDLLWSRPLPKQITGYSLLAVCALGMLISLRKRIARFRFGSFAKWRVFHAIFGLVALAVLFSHTGFRFGSNLNATLMTTFVGLNLLGSFAGIAAGLETRGSPRLAMYARRVRPGLTVAHYVLFWPLPVLLGFHIASAYLY